MKPKIFLICPVRRPKTGLIKWFIQKILYALFNIEDAWAKTQNTIKAYVAQLEQEGYDVYWPARDTDQSDPVGFIICETNCAEIKQREEIHIWFDPQSQGSLFDIGMTFAFLLSMNKRIIIANRHEVQRTPHKSFQNVLLELSLRTRG